MGLVDIPVVEAGAIKIREELASVIGVADNRLREVRKIVQVYGRPAIAAELGGDAAALLTVYTKLKEAVEAATETTVQELPN